MYKITKFKIKSFECPKSIRNHERKIFGKSNAWSTNRLSHQPSNIILQIVGFVVHGVKEGHPIVIYLVNFLFRVADVEKPTKAKCNTVCEKNIIEKAIMLPTFEVE